MKTSFLLFCCLLFLTCPPAWAGENRVALLLEHEQPSAWTELLRLGLENAAKDFAISTSVVIAPQGPAQKDIFRETAAANDLVLVTGESLHELLRDNAANFRRVKFGCIDAGIRAPNIMSITFADEQASFLAGAASAMLAKIRESKRPPVVGWLSGMDTPAMRTLYNGFSEGVKLVNPEAVISQQVVGSFTSPEVAARKTVQIIQRGAGIVALAAGAGNAGAIPLLKDGWRIDLDKGNPAPGCLGVISKDAAKAVYEIIKAFYEGQFHGKNIIVYNLENGGVDFKLLDGFQKGHGQKNAADLTRRIRELRNELIKGNIRIKSLRTRTLCDCLD